MEKEITEQDVLKEIFSALFCQCCCSNEKSFFALQNGAGIVDSSFIKKLKH